MKFSKFNVHSSRLSNGFSLIEIILAVFLAAIFLPAIGYSLSFALKSSSQGENFTKAYAYAQEGMEAIYTLKSANDGVNWDWNTVIPTNGDYQVKNDSGWTIVGPLPVIKEGIFERIVKLEDNPLVTDQKLGRKVTVTVAWKENGQDQEVKLVSYVTAH